MLLDLGDEGQVAGEVFATDEALCPLVLLDGKGDVDLGTFAERARDAYLAL